MWGDGGGFGGTNTDGRSSLGVARIVGDSSNYQGFNRYGGKNGECPDKIIHPGLLRFGSESARETEPERPVLMASHHHPHERR